MIFDCFMFSDEIDILRLRLAYLYETVDFFVIAESRYTHANEEKPLVFAENRALFEPYLSKIRYLEIPRLDKPLSAWDTEHFQRNYLKRALLDCADEDIVVISDVDEIVNIKRLTSSLDISKPQLIDMHMYYYYFNNLHVGALWSMSIITRYGYIKDIDIGDRNTYPALCDSHISESVRMNGWHFSYLFGNHIQRYVDKVRSFAHQEYNKPYYLLKSRIRYCVKNQMDLFERDRHFEKVAIEDFLDPKLVDCIVASGLKEEFVLGAGNAKEFGILDGLFRFYYKHELNTLASKLYRKYKTLLQ